MNPRDPSGRRVGLGSSTPSGDPRQMAGGTPTFPQPLEKYGTTPQALKNPSWLRRVLRGEQGAQHPAAILENLARAFDFPPSDVDHTICWFYGPTYEFHRLSRKIGDAVHLILQERSSAYGETAVSEELKYVGAGTMRPDDSGAQARQGGVAEYVRRWLSGDPSLGEIAPNFTRIWNQWLRSDDLRREDKIRRNALGRARVAIDIYQGLTPEEQLSLHVWPRSLSARTADAIRRVRDEGVMRTGRTLVWTWGPGVTLVLAWLLLSWAALSYQRNEPHVFTISGPVGEQVTVECWLDEWTTGVEIYIRTSDGQLEPVETWHYFDPPDAADDTDAFAEFDADALSRELGLPPPVPHPLRDAAVAACEQLAPPPLSRTRRANDAVARTAPIQVCRHGPIPPLTSWINAVGPATCVP